MQSEVGAVRAPMSGGEKVQDIHLVWKSDGKGIRGFGFSFSTRKGVNQPIIGFLALLFMTLGHKKITSFFFKTFIFNCSSLWMRC
jgi:hypothetical protein